MDELDFLVVYLVLALLASVALPNWAAATFALPKEATTRDRLRKFQIPALVVICVTVITLIISFSNHGLPRPSEVQFLFLLGVLPPGLVLLFLYPSIFALDRGLRIASGVVAGGSDFCVVNHLVSIHVWTRIALTLRNVRCIRYVDRRSQRRLP